MYFGEWLYDYNWNIIPAELHDYTPNNSVDELQKLLYDCAEEMNMHYQCSGSWVYTNDLLDAFHVMGYESATLLKKSNWNIETWKKILRTELDVGRPVLIRGGEIIDWNDWGNVHYFVCDGYDRSNPDMFHFNLGWGNNFYTTSDYTCEINHAVFGDNDYSNSQQIIIGISPTCSQIPHYINSVPYLQVYNLKKETALYNITLPQTGSLLMVENGGNLILTVGNKITLKSGFKAKVGSHFIAQIKNVNDCDCGGNLTVNNWMNAFTPNNDGSNDCLCIPVINANTFTIQVFDRYGHKIFEDAGKVTSNLACVWDGTGLYDCGDFNSMATTTLVIISFFNNCGQKVDNAYLVTAIGIDLSNQNKSFISKKLKDNISAPIIYPNPTTGIIHIGNYDNEKIKSIEIYSSVGVKMFGLQSSNKQIDISNLPNGIYFINITTQNNNFNYKVIKE